VSALHGHPAAVDAQVELVRGAKSTSITITGADLPEDSTVTTIVTMNGKTIATGLVDVGTKGTVREVLKVTPSPPSLKIVATAAKDGKTIVTRTLEARQ
jgi:hypothetical protein